MAGGTEAAEVLVATGEGGRERGETAWMNVLGLRAGDCGRLAMALVTSLGMVEEGEELET